MENENKGDLMINGNGSTAGGHFHNVNLNGNGKVNGDVVCERFEVNGNSTVYGNVTANEVQINGSADIKGRLLAENILFKGGAKIRGDVFFTKIRIQGHATSEGSLKGEEMILHGKIRIDGDCEAETFKADGQFTIGGLLTADSIDIKLYSESKVKEIGGESVTVKPKALGGLIKSLNPAFSIKLSVGTMEGDEIDLERVNAKVVRGNHVHIGADCDIGLVEYKDDFEQDTKAKVGENRKI